MLFNSSVFAVFLITLLLLYYLPFFRHLQVLLLTVASLYFYSYGEPQLVFLLAGSILLNSVCSYQIIRLSNPQKWLTIGIAGNLLVLVFFKYSGMLYRTAWGDPHTEIGQILTSIPLPIGISFFTFQGISLLIDLHRKPELQPSKPFRTHLTDVSYFIAFFPQLIAGPIVKAKEFLPQIRTGRRFSEIEWEFATRDLVVGFFLKMVVADHLRDQTFWLANPYFQGFSSLTLLVLIFGYSMQIFADFAGYSLIARGLAYLFGYQIPRNFHFPYIAQSFSEFWRRWHISLSSWLRDYLYIPLGGNKKGSIRTYANLMIVMALGGLWHGATWSYAIWGIWHGIALAAERLISAPNPNAAPKFNPLRALLVFTYVSLGWILFKMPNFSDALAFFYSLGTQWHLDHNRKILLNVLIFSIPVVGYHAAFLLQKVNSTFSFPQWTRAIAYGILLFFILTNSGAPGAFIYFQF